MRLTGTILKPCAIWRGNGRLPLLTSMYLGDRWEYLFRTEGDDFPLRAYGTALRDAEHCHLTLPAEDVWIFPQR